MRTPTLLQIVTMAAHLLTLSMIGGLVFSTLARPGRTLSHFLFALFAAALGGWGLASFLLTLRVLDVTIEASASVSLLNLHAGLMVIWVLAFYGFVISFFRIQSRLPRLAAVGAALIALAALVLIISGQWVTVSAAATVETDSLPLTIPAVLVVGLLSAYLGLAFWLIFSSENAVARLWLLPSALLFLAVGLHIIQAPALTSLASLLVMVAAVAMGWSVIWHQPFNPLNELNAELRTANRDLQQAVSELAFEKGRADALNAALRASNDYKSGFLANLSHELRTPLNSIIGYSELLAKGVYGSLNDKQADRLEKIQRNSVNLLELIGHILDLNRLDAGKLQLQMTVFDLRELLLRQKAQIETQGHDAHLELHVDIGQEPLMILGDPEQVQQIIQNLIKNALKLTHEGSIIVEAARVTVAGGISTATGAFELPAIGWLHDGTWVVLTISDTGSGIAPEDQARIFDEFAQIESAYAQQYGSTGLLLALTKRLVTLHDGAIWMKSRVGTGSAFFVALPSDTQKATRRPASKPIAETDSIS